MTPVKIMTWELLKLKLKLVWTTNLDSVTVHEGVKTIAKMVKWLLTSFHIRIKNMIIAFDADAGVERDNGEQGSHDALVLRVAEIECGACISEESSSKDGPNYGDFLEISHLTNFLKFQRVIVELLKINNGYNHTPQSTSASAAIGCCLSNASNPLLTGEQNGFCVSMKLSIPWKNGSLDTHKLDVEVNVDTVIASVQPCSLKWIQDTWELLENP